jgi:hypothetical protein
MNRNKKAAAQSETVNTGTVKRGGGVLGKLGLKKKAAPVVESKGQQHTGWYKYEPNTVQEETVKEDAQLEGEEEAPKDVEPTSEPLEPEADKKDEEPAAEDDEDDEAVDERDEDAKDDEVFHEPKAEEQSAYANVSAVAADELAEIEEREQPEPFTPRTAQSTGFLCGCL